MFVFDVLFALYTVFELYLSQKILLFLKQLTKNKVVALLKYLKLAFMTIETTKYILKLASLVMFGYFGRM